MFYMLTHYKAGFALNIEPNNKVKKYYNYSYLILKNNSEEVPV